MIEAQPVTEPTPPNPPPNMPEMYIVIRPFHTIRSGWLWAATTEEVGSSGRTAEYCLAKAKGEAAKHPGAVVVHLNPLGGAH